MQIHGGAVVMERQVFDRVLAIAERRDPKDDEVKSLRTLPILLGNCVAIRRNRVDQEFAHQPVVYAELDQLPLIDVVLLWLRPGAPILKRHAALD